MSKIMKMNLYHVIAWSIIAILMIIMFSLPNTIQDFGDNRLKTLLLAILFLFGFSSDVVLRFLERSVKWGFKRDERDDKIQTKATQIGFVIMIIVIYIICITLYLYYENIGSVPVGWVWFIAYSSVVVANLAAGVPALILYKQYENKSEQ